MNVVTLFLKNMLLNTSITCNTDFVRTKQYIIIIEFYGAEKLKFQTKIIVILYLDIYIIKEYLSNFL
jgi:hypothetical protein